MQPELVLYFNTGNKPDALCVTEMYFHLLREYDKTLY